jgi:3',5'-cyclic AMP phosphodiesterase CpdA
MRDDIVTGDLQLRIMQISDLHFGPPFVPEVAEAALASCIRLSPDVLVVSGDLTQRARREQFEAARDYLARFPSIPRMVIPGNHDVPLYNVARRLRDPHRNYREIISPELNTVLRVPGAVLVGLDSTAPRTAISNGRIHNWQLEFCAGAFAQSPPDATRIVVAHHHFAPAPDTLNDARMPKSQRAMNTFNELGVELIMGGHLHRAYIGNSLDFYPGEHRERGIIIAQSGTTTSRRGRGREAEKNTFNLIELCDGTIKITHYLYFDGEHGFVANSQHLFRRWRGR